MNLKYFKIKYLQWVLAHAALGFFVISVLSCFNFFQEGISFLDKSHFESIVIGVQDCAPDEAQSNDIEGGEGGANPLTSFSFFKKITSRTTKHHPLLVPRLHINIRHSRAPPAFFHA